MKMETSESKGYLSREQFSMAVNALPLVSIDLCLVADECLLLVKRKNEPARDWWFTPGGRINKNEAMSEAFERIIDNEIGDFDVDSGSCTLLGVWDHFYANSSFSSEVSTHYVNLSHLLFVTRAQKYKLEKTIGNCSQHADWKWLKLKQIDEDSSVHRYVKEFARAIVRHIANSKSGGGNF